MRDHSGQSDPVLSFPYLPTLGPVHPDAPTPQLWSDILAVNGTGRLLPHDKDIRWGGRKDEVILADEITRGPGHATVPTLLRRGRGVLKLHHYGRPPDLPHALDEAGKLAADHGAATARVLWFSTDPGQPERGCRLQLKTFDGEQPRGSSRVGSLSAETDQVQATFPAFAETMAAEGFAFLNERLHAGTLDGPILVAVAEHRVVGAIGPMAILPDSLGRARLLPQYFGVLPEARGHGHGRALWRAAMRWGQANGAAYQLLQTEIDGASDRLCLSEGLTTLGFINTAAA